MSEGTQQSQGSRILFVLAGLVIVVWGIQAAQSVLLPFLVAIFLAVIGASPVIWLEKKRVPSVVAVLLVVAGMVGVLVVMAALVGTSVTAFSEALPLYQKRIQEMTALSLSWLSGMGVDISDKLLLKHIDPGAAMRLIARMLSGLGSALANTFLILITVIFILLEASGFPRKLRTAFEDPHATFSPFSRFADNLRRYLAIKTWISLATGTIIAVWLALLGVDFPLLWGLLAFLLNYVPNLGSIIAAAPAVLIALIQLGPGTAVLSAAGYLVVNVVLGNAVEPKLMGRGLGLSTLVVFLSLIFWGSLLGPVGMILSVPITMTLKIALENSEQTRWIAVMLGTGEPVD